MLPITSAIQLFGYSPEFGPGIHWAQTSGQQTPRAVFRALAGNTQAPFPIEVHCRKICYSKEFFGN